MVTQNRFGLFLSQQTTSGLLQDLQITQDGQDIGYHVTKTSFIREDGGIQLNSTVGRQ